MANYCFHTQDAIMTGPEMGMDTTVGSFVFKGEKPKGNAVVLQQVRVLRSVTMLKVPKKCLFSFSTPEQSFWERRI